VSCSRRCPGRRAAGAQEPRPGAARRAHRAAAAGARATGIAVLGELDLFARAGDLKADRRATRPKLLAITGTNGKTTTTAMTRCWCNAPANAVAMAGNIGPTLLDTLSARLDDCPRSPRTLPASSSQGGGTGCWSVGFQLAGLRAQRRHGAQHHAGPPGLARQHGRLPAAKARIFGQQAPGHQPRRPAGRGAWCRRRCPAKGPRQAGQNSRSCASAWTRRAGPVTSAWWSRTAWPGWCARCPPTKRLKRRKDDDDEIHLQRLMPADALRMRGRHNAANALAALALATAIGCPLAPMLHGLREYVGEPHRVQFIGPHRRGRGLRRHQGHQRRRHGGGAGRPGCRQGAGPAGGHPGRRRQGAGLRAAGRAAAAPRPRGGH
jgi:UDP-N-acetylmuramoylalanine--D-glutamate ligase